jgi:putative transposase
LARQPRLILPGQTHWVQQAALAGRAAFADDTDRGLYLAALREEAAAADVRLHAFALTGAAVHLLATPASAEGLSRLMQGVGRRYVSAHHRRHGGAGTLWQGRFRAALVEPGALRLTVMQLIESLAPEAGHGSGDHHQGHGERRLPLSDLPEWWGLGNTPFERERAWQQRLADGLPPGQQALLMRAARGGWVLGSEAFVAEVALAVGRPARPRAAGRPPRSRPAQG